MPVGAHCLALGDLTVDQISLAMIALRAASVKFLSPGAASDRTGKSYLFRISYANPLSAVLNGAAPFYDSVTCVAHGDNLKKEKRKKVF